jgi:hypothetical protein
MNCLSIEISLVRILQIFKKDSYKVKNNVHN